MKSRQSIKITKGESVFIPVASPDLAGNELNYLTDCIKTGWVSSNGPYVEKFATRFAKYCGVKYGIPVSNGTVALHLALLALGIGKGDEVLVPGLTFVATANAVLYTGAKPVFVESLADTWCMDPKDVERKITKKTKAVIPVHLYGHPADMFAINKIAKKHKLFVVEDAAEAHGALINGKKVGSLSDISCFSFFGNKTITMGEGGIVLTNNKLWADKIKYLRDGARDRSVNKYYHTELGYNYALTNLQAAVGLAQLERITEFISKKRRIAAWYKKYFKGFDKIMLSPEAKNVKNTYWMFSIILDKDSKVDRDDLIKLLARKGIQTRPFFHPMHKLPYINQSLILRNVEFLASHGLNLPSGVNLTESEIRYIVDSVKDILVK